MEKGAFNLWGWDLFQLVKAEWLKMVTSIFAHGRSSSLSFVLYCGPSVIPLKNAETGIDTTPKSLITYKEWNGNVSTDHLGDSGLHFCWQPCTWTSTDFSGYSWRAFYCLWDYFTALHKQIQCTEVGGWTEFMNVAEGKIWPKGQKFKSGVNFS